MAKNNNKTNVTGTVYARTYIGPNPQYKGMQYIGETIDIKTRNKRFHNRNNRNYGGRKIEKARQTLGVNQEDWETKILYQRTFSCTANTHDKVKKQAKAHIKPIQTEEILKNNSIEHGFNTSTSDGLAGVTLDEEARKKIGAASKGRKHSPETKAKISTAIKGRKVSDATKAKISASNSGKKRTAEQNAAQSKRLKGKEPKAASEGAAKWREANPGGWWSSHPISSEMRTNIKKSLQGLYPDYEAFDRSGKSLGIFKSMPEIFHNLGDAPGSVNNNLKHDDDTHFTKNGYRYIKIK